MAAPAIRGARRDGEAGSRRRRYRAARDAVGEDANIPGARISRHGIPARGTRDARFPAARSVMPLSTQLINVMAALLLLIAFAMLSQRRIRSLIYLYAWQGVVLTANSLVVAYSSDQSHLYYSALLTFALKVVVLPWILHRLILRLNIRWDVETLI